MIDSTLFGLAPREETIFGVAPPRLIATTPMPPQPSREDGRAIYTNAIQAVARLSGYARRAGRPELESKALQAIETLLELLP